MSPVVTNASTVGLPRCAVDDTGRSSSVSNAYVTGRSGKEAPGLSETPTGGSTTFGPQPIAATTIAPASATPLTRIRYILVVALLSHEIVVLVREQDVVLG